jgi:hypothetical protein
MRPALKQAQAEIASRMGQGATFDSIEDEIIDPSAFSEAEKAALWLYGWSFVDWRRQRREAVAQIDRLVDGAASAERAVAQLRIAGGD